MIYDYLITLKRSDYRFVDQVSQLLYVFALLAFGYYFYHVSKNKLVYPVAGIAVVACWVYSVVKKRKKGQAFFRLGLFAAAAGWFLGPETNIWMGILYAVTGILEKQVKFPQEIGFSEEGIYFNSLPKKVLQWNEVHNVLIKDGLITIDQKNNKLLQKEIEGYVTADIENEFNAFASRCIAASAVV